MPRGRTPIIIPAGVFMACVETCAATCSSRATVRGYPWARRRRRSLRDGDARRGGYFFCTSNTPFIGMPLANYLAQLAAHVRQRLGWYRRRNDEGCTSPRHITQALRFRSQETLAVCCGNYVLPCRNHRRPLPRHTWCFFPEQPHSCGTMRRFPQISISRTPTTCGR